ncbi:MAG: hypothetical protein Q4F13_08445 [Pseudomonadota bacterium]|nr:hypothetical protein [Pseudomonadota bacterium]
MAALRHLSRSRQVQFVISAFIVAEAAPLSRDVADLSARRADLIGELCDSALVSPDRLVKAEITALASGNGKPDSMIDPEGRWHPEIPVDSMAKQPHYWVREYITDELRAVGCDRKEVRRRLREFFKGNEPTLKLKTLLRSREKEFRDALLATFPIGPQYSEIMIKYCFCEATEHQFIEALNRSLADPRWMAIWLDSSSGVMHPIAEIVRKPGRDIAAQLGELMKIAQSYAKLLLEGGATTSKAAVRAEIAKVWNEQKSRQLVNLVKSLAIQANVRLQNIDDNKIEECCAGLRACVKSLYSSIWDNVSGERKKSISPSQPVDALHALYAPYVDVFRAYRYMSPHIQRQVARDKTTVVPLLTELVGVLQDRLK